MFLLNVCIYLGVFSGIVEGSLRDYAFEFPNKGVADFVQLWSMRSFEQFTVCFWMQSSDQSGGTPFSYAVPGTNNDLVIITSYNNFTVWFGNEKSQLSVSANDGVWHHNCVSWENAAGSLSVFKDGVLSASETRFKIGHKIPSGGSMMLGLNQADGPVSDRSFQGFLSNLNAWDYVLCQEIITRMSKACLSCEGNVHKWSHFKQGVEGDLRLYVPSPCAPTEASKCDSNPCKNGGICNELANGFNCTCPQGSFGDRCDAEFFINSTILADNRFYQDHLYQFLAPVVGNHSEWLLCYRASSHGFSLGPFHSNCDGKYHTITIIKVNQYVFGGYTDTPWESGEPRNYGSTPNAFIFSLRNGEGLGPFKSMVTDPSRAIEAVTGYGPVFGVGSDIFITHSANRNTNSHTHFGHSYSVPSGVQDRKTVLAGINNFSTDEWEVFYLAID